MYILLIAVLLQQTQVPPTIDLPSATTTFVEKPAKAPPKDTPQLRKTGNVTTPELNQNSPATPYEMGRDIGGQAESIGGLKQSVKDLQDKREKIDRPDINDLLLSRNHLEWLLSGIALIFGTIWILYERYKQILWTDVIRPRIIRALHSPPDSTT